jgi:hypothetical protein
VNQWVWLRLLHRLITSLEKRAWEDGTKVFGPFKILEHVGEVACMLQLRANACLHDVFHVSLLKKFYGFPPTELGTLPPICYGCVCLEPSAVTKSRVAKQKLELLLNWKGHWAANASWLDVEDFRQLYPSFQLVDKLLLQRGSVEMHEPNCRGEAPGVR